MNINIVIKAGWFFLVFLVITRLLNGGFLDNGASLLEAIIYQLTDGNPKAVGRLFE